MKTKTKLFMIILMMVLSVLACSIFEVDGRDEPRVDPRTGNNSNSTSTSKADFRGKSETDVIELEVEADMRRNSLKINTVKLTQGEMVLRLVNPENIIVFEETLTAPAKFHEHYDLEIIPGIWRLEMEMMDASGSYNIKWEAKN